MGRKNSNAGGRRFDTRMTFKEKCRILGISPLQRVKLMKYIKQNLKEGEHLE